MAPRYPQQFGKYVLVKKLATGGMAEIFKAKTAGAEGFEKDIVIKRILPNFSQDDAFVKMFIDEASITAKLQHANIVQIFDFDVVGQAYYIAMEFVDGEDLHKVMEDGHKQTRPLSVPQCVWITIELAKGLHYAHMKEHKGRPLNIIHRDISPHNAMLTFGGEVKLMDFGIAKAAERSTKTQVGTVKGKVAYMSPEQARGKNLDGRSDLFALATILWELLCNRQLFMRESEFATLTAVLKDPIDRPSKHNRGVNQELDDILLTALEKDRNHRQRNVEEFCRELTRWYYKHVDDLEGEKLKTYMRSLYSDKLEQRRRDAAGEAFGRDEPTRGLPARPAPANQATGLMRRARSSVNLRRAEPKPLPAKPQFMRPAPIGAKSVGLKPDAPKPLQAKEEKAVWVAPSRVNIPAEDGDCRTIESSVEEIFGAAAPQRAIPPTPRATESRTAKSKKKAGQKKTPTDDFFTKSATLADGDGPDSDAVMAAVRNSKDLAKGQTPESSSSAGPDMTLDGRITASSVRGNRQAPEAKAGKPSIKKKNSGLTLFLVLAVVLAGAGIAIAFLVAPQ